MKWRPNEVCVNGDLGNSDSDLTQTNVFYPHRRDE